MRDYPLVEYAKSIHKNTAELTTTDMANFTKWWLKQKPREDLLKVTPAQRKAYEADVAAMKQWREGENMARKHTTGSSQAAQTSRLAERGIESPINNGEEEIIIHPEEKVVCSMELTQVDVEALLWAINEIFENYDLTGTIHDLSLKGLQEALKGVE